MNRTRHSKIIVSVVLIFALMLLISGQAYAQVTGRDVAKLALKYEGRGTVSSSAKYVQYIYAKLGIKLPGTLSGLLREGTLIRKGEKLQYGDIVIFGKSTSKLIAAGIYVGGNRFIISYSPYKTIKVVNLSSTKNFLCARRIIKTGSIREKVIKEGLKYLGTPYEYNSNRSSTATFDCSDFVRRTYYDATGKWLPGNSRTQADFVKKYGKITTNWRNLKQGDLMFFIDPAKNRINHVAIYMGDSRILHATSVSGVSIKTMNNYYNNRFYFGGNILDYLMR